MQLVAKYIKSPTTDAPNRVQAAVEHPTGSVVLFEGDDLAAAETMVDEYYLPLVSSSTVEDFVEAMWGNTPTEVREIFLSENPTLEEIRSAFQITSNETLPFAEGTE